MLIKEIWEILVPTKYGDTIKPIRTRHHKQWDKLVRKITGGLTVCGKIKGQWVYKDTLFEENVIPVKIMCTYQQIQQIVDITMKHYRQKAVLAYKISNDVIYKEQDERTTN